MPETSINELMVEVVAPATDTLWGVADPQTDSEWEALDDAADEVILTFRAIKLGGTGENDVKWASEPAWDAYADEVVLAGMAAKRAIAARDLDALFAAGDVLYPPCENCHLEYHPGVIETQSAIEVE